MAVGQNWTKNDEGGYFANPKLSSELRVASQPMMKFMQFARTEPEFGKQNGDSWDYEKVTDIESAGGQLDELLPMTESKFTIRKASATVTEWGNAIPWTGKLETLSAFNPNDPVQKALMNDQAKTLDKAVAAYMKAGQVFYVPTGTVGSPTNTIQAGGTLAVDATRNIQMVDVKAIRDYMVDTLLTPPYDEEGNIMCLAHTRAMRGIKDDAEFIEAAKYGDPERLFRGEVGMIEGVRFIEVNHRQSLYRHGLDNDGDGLPDCGEALFFGDDPCVMGVAEAPHMRAKEPGDYGRSKGLAWYSLLGFDQPWRFDNDGEARIVWVTSANNTLGPPAGY